MRPPSRSGSTATARCPAASDTNTSLPSPRIQTVPSVPATRVSIIGGERSAQVLCIVPTQPLAVRNCTTKPSSMFDIDEPRDVQESRRSTASISPRVVRIWSITCDP